MSYKYINKQGEEIDISKIDNRYLLNAYHKCRIAAMQSRNNIIYGSMKNLDQKADTLVSMNRSISEFGFEIARRLKNKILTKEELIKDMEKRPKIYNKSPH